MIFSQVNLENIFSHGGLSNIVHLSFDKGYWHKDNKAFLETCVDKVVMPKKGKCNKKEQAEESHRIFKLLRNRHSVV